MTNEQKKLKGKIKDAVQRHQAALRTEINKIIGKAAKDQSVSQHVDALVESVDPIQNGDNRPARRPPEGRG